MKNNLFGKSLVTVETLKREDIDSIFSRTDEMKRLVNASGGDDRLKGKIMGALFFEPSSRTFSSFIAAMQRIGGGIIPLSGMGSTSAAKGETLEDTAKVFSCYADILIMRHQDKGSVNRVAKAASVPVINAGDGINEHPTQALLDSYTIQSELGKIEKLHILMIGDLGHYRPVNSLAKLLALYPSIKMSFASPKEVAIQDSLRSYLKKHKINFKEYGDFKDLLRDVDVLYVTRVKKEYMDKALYHRIQGSYIIDNSLVKRMKKKSLIMHPLPRVGEIAVEVDKDSRAVYLNKQMRNGMYVRMALLDMILRK